jgi:Tfp pilus assembly protein PilO
MKRLPTAKRNQLIMVIIATMVTVSVIYYCLISPQKDKNSLLGTRIREQQERLQTIKKAIKETDTITTDLADLTLQLNRAEQDVASGDVNAWTYDTIRRFKANYHVDIPSIAQPTVTDVDVLASFPYRQAKITLNGSAFFHDLGKFVSDFENNFPHMRMINLIIEPSQGSGTEKLSFRMEVITLVKPNT